MMKYFVIGLMAFCIDSAYAKDILSISGLWKMDGMADGWNWQFNRNGTFEEVGFNINPLSAKKEQGKWIFIGNGKMIITMYEGQEVIPAECEFVTKDRFACGKQFGDHMFSFSRLR